MRNRWRRWGYSLGMAAALAASSERPTQAGPIIDWFKSWCQPPPSTCANGNCNTPKPNPYYPAANTPPVLPGPVVQPGAVIQPGTVIQPGAAQPGFLQPNPSFPNTVTPGPAFGPRTTNFAPVVSQATYYAPATPATYYAPTAQATYYAPATPATYYAPVSQATYYAPTTNCPTCPAPGTAGAAPGTAMGMVPGAVNSARPTIVSYAPYLTYRDQWVRVPVTYYRPVNVVDPATGAVTTAMQPCTATAWQVQRVPVGGRSFFSQYQPAPGMTGAAIATPPTVIMPNAAMAQPGVCPQGLCPNVPGYSGWSMPSTPSIVAAPITPSGPASGAGGGLSNGPASGVASGVASGTASGVAADSMPRLLPGEGANSANYPPLSDVPSGSLVPVPQPFSSSSDAAGAAVPPLTAPTAPPSATPPSAAPPSAAPPSAAPQSAEPPFSGAPPASGEPSLAPATGEVSPSGDGVPQDDVNSQGQSTSGPSRPGTRVTPVPDPDAAPFRVPQQATPRLIVPRDRVASGVRSSPGSLAAAHSVGSTKVTSAQPARRMVPGVSAPRADGWDDSGWRSAVPGSAPGSAPGAAPAAASRSAPRTTPVRQ